MTFTPDNKAAHQYIRQEQSLSASHPFDTKKLLLPGLISALMLAACGSDSDNNNPVNQTDNGNMVGIWSSTGYGELAKVESNRITTYAYTSDYCGVTGSSIGSDADLAADGWTLSDDENRLTEPQLDYPGVVFGGQIYTRLESLPAACDDDNLIDPINNDITDDFERDFNIFYQTFEEYYPSFDKRSVDWAALKAEVESDLGVPNSEQSLYLAMANMISPLRDSHVEIYWDEASYNVTHPEGLDNRLIDEYVAANGTIETDEQYQAFIQYQEEQLALINEIRLSYASSDIQQTANEQLTWYSTQVEGANIGYLIISEMQAFSPEFDTDEMDQATLTADLNALQNGLTQVLTSLQDTEGLIIDVRTNPGGYDAVSQLIVRNFLDTERSLYTKQARSESGRTAPVDISLTPVDNAWTKPVVVLTSRMTTSAAEVFSLMMAQLPQVTMVGEPTQGAISDVLEKSLPSGLTFELVNEYYLDANGNWYEVSGVPVEVEVPFGSQDDRANETDSGIETAATQLLD